MTPLDIILGFLLALVAIPLFVAILIGGLCLVAMLASIIIGTAWDMFGQLFLGKEPRWD